jgi:hypothetical protein
VNFNVFLKEFVKTLGTKEAIIILF